MMIMIFISLVHQSINMVAELMSGNSLQSQCQPTFQEVENVEYLTFLNYFTLYIWQLFQI